MSNSDSAGEFDLHLVSVNNFCVLSRVTSELDRKRVPATPSATVKPRTVGEVGGPAWGGEDVVMEVDPLTIAHVEFCAFNKTKDETIFWDTQTVAKAAEGTVGEQDSFSQWREAATK